MQWGLNGDIPVPGDYNDDGRASSRVSAGRSKWYLLSSSSNYTLSQCAPLGQPGDLAVPRRLRCGRQDGPGRVQPGLGNLVGAACPRPESHQQWGTTNIPRVALLLGQAMLPPLSFWVRPATPLVPSTRRVGSSVNCFSSSVLLPPEASPRRNAGPPPPDLARRGSHPRRGRPQGDSATTVVAKGGTRWPRYGRDSR